MTNAILLARFWGWLTLIVAILFLARPEQLREIKLLMVENRAFSLSYGLLSLVLGLVSVILHNDWPLAWPALVSLFGWLALLKGIYVIAFNDVSKKPTLETRLRTTRVALGIVGLLALLLIAASTP